MKQPSIIFEMPKTAIARGTQEAANLAGGMAVVYTDTIWQLLHRWIGNQGTGADCAPALLARKHAVIRLKCEAILGLKMSRLPVLRVFVSSTLVVFPLVLAQSSGVFVRH